MDMIETKALEFAYPAEEGEKPVLALRGVDTAIEKGSFVVVLGHNGSGKSTFAKCLNAILLPCGGKVYVEGMDTQDEACLLEIRRRVGMVFQNPDNQIVANVVEEDVAFAPENLGVASGEIRRRVDSALSAVGMSGFARHAPHLLSGGQIGIHFPGAYPGIDGNGLGDHFVGGVALGGDDSHHPAPLGGLGHDPGRGPQPLRVRYGGAPEFLHDQHTFTSRTEDPSSGHSMPPPFL